MTSPRYISSAGRASATWSSKRSRGKLSAVLTKFHPTSKHAVLHANCHLNLAREDEDEDGDEDETCSSRRDSGLRGCDVGEEHPAGAPFAQGRPHARAQIAPGDARPVAAPRPHSGRCGQYCNYSTGGREGATLRGILLPLVAPVPAPKPSRPLETATSRGDVSVIMAIATQWTGNESAPPAAGSPRRPPTA